MYQSKFSPHQDVQLLGKLDDVTLKKVLRFLHLDDLCNVADVCKRFKSLAVEVFKSVYADDRTLDVLQLIEGHKDFHRQWFMVRWQATKFLTHAKKLFRNFGQYIKTLRLTGTGEMDGMDEMKLLTLVKTYCGTLTELTLIDFGNSDDFTTDLLPLFGGLEKLSICADEERVCESFVECFSDCHNLKYLNVANVTATLWINHNFPKLETLIISKNTDFYNDDFESFLKVHGKLRTLKYEDSWILSDFFSMISKSSPELETVHCQFDEICDYDDYDFDESTEEVEQNLLQLSKLKSLKNFTFTCQPCEENAVKLLIDAFESESTPIEYCQLFDCEIDTEIVAGLSKMRWLKTLRLTRCKMTEETLADVNEHLNRVDQIIIKDIEWFDVNDQYHQSQIVSLAENVCVIETLIEPTVDQNSSEMLNILNDDCFLQIFEWLPLRDLCNVADVCMQFRENSQKAFQSKYINFRTRDIHRHLPLCTDIDMVMAEQLFRNFGYFIRKLQVEGRYFKNTAEQETIMFLATKYCNSVYFETLTLANVNIEVKMRWIFPLIGMFHRLPTLELHWCQLCPAFGKFLSNCHIEFIQVFESWPSEWMKYTFWYTRRMMLLEVQQMPESAIVDLIKLNGHFESLVIHNSSFSSKILSTVADHMPKLREFGFMGKNLNDPKIRKNILHLARIQSLETLSLNCNSFSMKNLIDELWKASTRISSLTMSFGMVDMEVVNKLCKLKSSLTVLRLQRVHMKNVSLIDIVKQLPLLNELDIDIKGICVGDIIEMVPFAETLTKLQIGSERSQVKIDLVHYRSILEKIRCRPKAIKLIIDITSQSRHVFVPKSILQENICWLQIINQIQENLHLIMTDSESENEFPSSESSTDDESHDDSSMSVEYSDVTIEGSDSDDIEM